MIFYSYSITCFFTFLQSNSFDLRLSIPYFPLSAEQYQLLFPYVVFNEFLCFRKCKQRNPGNDVIQAGGFQLELAFR